jgi:hypothetical protein
MLDDRAFLSRHGAGLVDFDGTDPSDDQDHSAPVILANSGGLSISVTVITTNAISGEEYIVPPRDTKPKDESEPQSPWR